MQLLLCVYGNYSLTGSGYVDRIEFLVAEKRAQPAPRISDCSGSGMATVFLSSHSSQRDFGARFVVAVRLYLVHAKARARFQQHKIRTKSVDT